MYIYDEEFRRRLQEEAARNGTSINKSASTRLSPQQVAQLAAQKSAEDKRKDSIINAGAQAGGALVGEATGVEGLGGYASGAYNLYDAIKGGGSSKDRITQGVQGASQIAGAAGVPGAGMVGGVIGGAQVASSNLPADKKADATKRIAEDVAAGVATGGISGAVQLGDKYLLDGKINNVRNKYDKVMDSPLGAITGPARWGANQLTDKALEKGFSLFGSGKGKDQVQRDAVRKILRESGFLGDPKAEDWNLENPDGTSFDIGKDGGARLGDGRRYFDVNTETQGNAIGSVNPLAYLITGGNEKLATEFSGYFTNTVTQGAGATDPKVANLNALDKYKKAGFDTAEKAIAGIDDLLKAGKIDEQKAQAFKGGIATVFGTATKAAAPQGATPVRRGNSGGAGKKRRQKFTYQPNVYTPNVYAPTTTAPMGAPSAYGDAFAESLANIYRMNQE